MQADIDIFFSNYYTLQSVYFELLDLDLPQLDLWHEFDSQKAVNWVERAF